MLTDCVCTNHNKYLDRETHFHSFNAISISMCCRNLRMYSCHSNGASFLMHSSCTDALIRIKTCSHGRIVCTSKVRSSAHLMISWNFESRRFGSKETEKIRSPELLHLKFSSCSEQSQRNLISGVQALGREQRLFRWFLYWKKIHQWQMMLSFRWGQSLARRFAFNVGHSYSSLGLYFHKFCIFIYCHITVNRCVMPRSSLYPSSVWWGGLWCGEYETVFQLLSLNFKSLFVKRTCKHWYVWRWRYSRIHWRYHQTFELIWKWRTCNAASGEITTNNE